MRLICPNCVAQYEVDEGIIPPEGRDVQCANCGHNWFQDALQMLSTDVDMKTGTGDPDSDVSAELFNDLEGKIDHQSSNTPAQQPLPDPNDMLPDEAPPAEATVERDEPPMPSSRMDQEVLDVLRSEAEYSSGEKPPAAEQAETAEQSDATEPEAPSDPDIGDEDDGLDEIRRRIMEMETAVQENSDQAPEPEIETAPDLKPELVIEPEPAETVTPEPEQDLDYATEPQSTPDSGNPFSRPSRNGARNTDRESLRPDREYEENIPLEEVATNPAPDQIIDTEEIVISDEVDAPSGSGSPFRKLKTDSGPDQRDDLYGASNDENIPRKDMFPDIDELSSEIANEADNTKYDHEPVVDQTEKTKGGFFKGLVYALLIYGVIAALYTMKASIIKVLPQSEGLLDMLTQAVDKMIDLLGPLVDMVKGLIG